MQHGARTRSTAWAALAITAALALTILSCASAPAPKAPSDSVDDILARGARVMWVAAHPDDEALVGAILARASLWYGDPLYFLVLTRGEGGECCRPEGCLPDLPTVRAAELRDVAARYHAELQHEAFWNAPLPVESFPPRHEIAKHWKAQKDPALVVAAAIRRFKPDVVFTFDPDRGFTGHPEHQLASRFATAGVRLAADGAAQVEGLAPHRVAHVFYGLNAYWPSRLFGIADPAAVTDVFDATLPCVGGRRCIDVMAEHSRAHRSQANDMGTARTVARWLTRVYLRRVDPFTEKNDPYDPPSPPATR